MSQCGSYVNRRVAARTASRASGGFKRRISGPTKDSSQYPVWRRHTYPAADRPPLAGRNSGIGPNFVSFDLRLAKDCRLGSEGDRRISAIIEAFNLTSYRVEGRKDVGPTDLLGFTSAFDPRQIQLAVKFQF